MSRVATSWAVCCGGCWFCCPYVFHLLRASPRGTRTAPAQCGRWCSGFVRTRPSSSTASARPRSRLWTAPSHPTLPARCDCCVRPVRCMRCFLVQPSVRRWQCAPGARCEQVSAHAGGADDTGGSPSPQKTHPAPPPPRAPGLDSPEGVNPSASPAGAPHMLRVQFFVHAVAHGGNVCVCVPGAGHGGSPASLAIPAGKSKRGLSLVVATSGQAHYPRLRAPGVCW